MTYKELGDLFGIKSETLRYRLKHGMTLEEALLTPINYYMDDLTDRRFTKLVVKYRIQGTHTQNSIYHCVCDCGNECDVYRSNLVSGRQKSCGCLQTERRHEKLQDLTGETINGVKLLYRVEDDVSPSGTRFQKYRCICPFCGEEFEARAANIKSGNTKGCGCTRHQFTHHIDLTGLDFEYCHVNKRLPNKTTPSGGMKVMYECTCICGQIYSDWAHRIAHGHSNCGCIYIASLGEKAIREYLENKGIKFTSGYWFDDLRGERNMPYYFDFALFDNNGYLLGLIEYQGEQHYHECKRSIKDFGKNQREVSDPAKRKYCKEHNIPLFEIAYNENTFNKCEKIFNLLYHDNTVPSL